MTDSGALLTQARAKIIGDSDAFSILLTTGGVPLTTMSKASYIITSLETAILLTTATTPTQLVLNNTLGKITISVTSTNTTGKAPGTYFHQLRVLLTTGQVITVLDGEYQLQVATAPVPA